jgi:signal transduction histidine kinase
MGLDQPLWRAVIVFRLAALGYAVVLLASKTGEYEHPVTGWLIIAVMAVWTVVSGIGYRLPSRRGWPLLTADLLVGIACLLASRWVISAEDLSLGHATLPMAWVAGPVLAWGVSGGRRRGAVAALLMGGADMVIRGGVTDVTVNGTVLLLLAGVVIGYMATLTTDAERRLQRATEMEAATRERERLARGIHDSVLQVLALVQRRGTELGGEAADLGRLAGEQEATLRALVAADPGPQPPSTQADLRTMLGSFASAAVSLATPATPVTLPRPVAAEVVAAVGSALDNVRVHCGAGARVWILVEDERDAVTVTVRDDGPGFPSGRLVEAAAAGRLGMAQSIQGRVRDLGGTVEVTSAPGQGTEVELRVPRQHRLAA